MASSLKKKKWLMIFLLVLVVLVYLWYTGRLDTDTGPDRAVAASYAKGLDRTTVADQLLVDLQDDVTESQVRLLRRKYGLKLKLNSRHALGERLYRAVVKRGRLAKLIERLRSDPAIEHAELDAVYAIPPLEAELTRFDAAAAEEGEASFPNDPKYRYQWHMKQINMPAAWPNATGEGVIVAVIDTGVTYADRTDGKKKFRRVPDLANTEIVAGYDWINRNEHALDDHGHGTHVAGTIAQSTNNGIGVTGVAYRAKIMPLKVLSARGFGSVGDIADAVRFAADHGAKVINMSLGGSRSSRILASAVDYAVKKGVTVVCAAGNDGRGKVSYPAAYPGAIAVAATQFDRSTTFYSNWGKEIALAAPGGNTRVDQNKDGMPDGVLQNTILIGNPAENDYLLFMGTSMASPHVAGVAALVVERGVTDPKAVLKVLQKTAKHPKKKKWDERYGAGIVDAAAAVSKTTTEWGGYKLGLSALLGLLLLVRLRERSQLAFSPGAGGWLALLVGSAGLFFLPSVGLGGGGALSTVLQNGLPSWDIAVLGVGGHANPLFFSAALPLLLSVLLWGVKRLRGVLFGLAVGVGGHLLFHLFFVSADVAWIPNLLWLDGIWLLLNGVGCLVLAHLLVRGR